MHETDPAEQSPAVTSRRTMELLVALLLLVASAVVILDSVRLGFGWRDDGPAPGFFPFWVAVVLGASSLVNLAAALRDRSEADLGFVTRAALGRIVAVLLPTILYLAAIGGISVGPVALPGLGIYIASGVFIAGFMIAIGREPVLKSLVVGAAVPFVMFWMFERWFLVALPKGPMGIF